MSTPLLRQLGHDRDPLQDAVVQRTSCGTRRRDTAVTPLAALRWRRDPEYISASLRPLIGMRARTQPARVTALATRSAGCNAHPHCRIALSSIKAPA
jgi:hypothetical protein